MNTSTPRPPATLRLIRTWRRRKSRLKSLGTMGMPMWLGAKARPMYSPKSASCTPTNAAALPGGRTSTTTVT